MYTLKNWKDTSRKAEITDEEYKNLIFYKKWRYTKLLTMGFDIEPISIPFTPESTEQTKIDTLDPPYIPQRDVQQDYIDNQYDAIKKDVYHKPINIIDAGLPTSKLNKPYKPKNDGLKSPKGIKSGVPPKSKAATQTVYKTTPVHQNRTTYINDDIVQDDIYLNGVVTGIIIDDVFNTPSVIVEDFNQNNDIIDYSPDIQEDPNRFSGFGGGDGGGSGSSTSYDAPDDNDYLYNDYTPQDNSYDSNDSSNNNDDN